MTCKFPWTNRTNFMGVWSIFLIKYVCRIIYQNMPSSLITCLIFTEVTSAFDFLISSHLFCFSSLSACDACLVHPSFLSFLLSHYNTLPQITVSTSSYLPILTFDLCPLPLDKVFSRFAAGCTEGRIHCGAVCVFPRSG